MEEKTQKNKKTILIISIIVLVVIIAAAVFVLFSPEGSQILKVSKSSSKTSKSGHAYTEYVDNNGNKAAIPAGFTMSTNKDEQSISTGLVIVNDNDKNEFVWIPVANPVFDASKMSDREEIRSSHKC